MKSNSSKLAAIAGITYAVVNVGAGFSTGAPPDLDAPVPEVRAYFVDHRSAIVAATIVAVVSVPLILWFLAGVARQLRAGADDQGPTAGAVVVASAAAGAVLYLLACVVGASLVQIEEFASGSGDDSVRLVWLLSFLLIFGSNAAFAAGIGAVAVAGRRSSFAPWFCTFSAIVALVLLVTAGIGIASASAATAVGVSFALVPLWIVVGGVVSLRSPEAA